MFDSKFRYLGRGHEFRSGYNHNTGLKCSKCNTRIKHQFQEGVGVVTCVLINGEWLEINHKNPIPPCLVVPKKTKEALYDTSRTKRSSQKINAQS